MTEGLLLPPLAVGSPGAAFGAAPLASLLLPPPLTSPLLAEGCLGIACAMACCRRRSPCAQLAPPLVRLRSRGCSPGAALRAALLTPLLPPPLSSPLRVEGGLGIALAVWPRA